MKRKLLRITALLAVLLVGYLVYDHWAHGHSAPSGIQYGTGGDDGVYCMCIGRDNSLYVASSTSGSLYRERQGESDVVVEKRSASRVVRWGVQFGRAKMDWPESVCTDAQGNVYVVGCSYGELHRYSEQDAFITKISPIGTVMWKRIIAGKEDDQATGAAVSPDGHIYVVGWTCSSLLGDYTGDESSDAWIAKYDEDGNRVWGKQFGSYQADTEALAVCVDRRGSVYVAGDGTNLFDQHEGIVTEPWNAFIAKYDPSGNLMWGHEYGGSVFDRADAVSADSSENVYIAGELDSGDSHMGSNPTKKGFIAKYASDGNQLWVRKQAVYADTRATSLAIGKDGNPVLVGVTEGALYRLSRGGNDAYIVQYDKNGNLLWRYQWGTEADDNANAVVVDSGGKVIVGGYTEGNLYSQSKGGGDAFIATFKAKCGK